MIFKIFNVFKIYASIGRYIEPIYPVFRRHCRKEKFRPTPSLFGREGINFIVPHLLWHGISMFVVLTDWLASVLRCISSNSASYTQRSRLLRHAWGIEDLINLNSHRMNIPVKITIIFFSFLWVHVHVVYQTINFLQERQFVYLRIKQLTLFENKMFIIYNSIKTAFDTFKIRFFYFEHHSQYRPSTLLRFYSKSYVCASVGLEYDLFPSRSYWETTLLQNTMMLEHEMLSNLMSVMG